MKRLVLGIGNVLLRDEGIGCHVVHALDDLRLSDVEIMDAGTCPDVLQSLEGADKVVVVDAVRGGGMPGQVYRFRPEEVDLEQEAPLSLHETSFIDGWKLAQLWRSTGEVIIIGVEPKELDWGLELSPELQEKMPEIIDAVLAELNNTNPKGETKC